MKTQFAHVLPNISMFIYNPKNYIHRMITSQIYSSIDIKDPENITICASHRFIKKGEDTENKSQELVAAMTYSIDTHGINIKYLYLKDLNKENMEVDDSTFSDSFLEMSQKLFFYFFWLCIMDNLVIHDANYPKKLYMSNGKFIKLEGYTKYKIDLIIFKSSASRDISENIFRKFNNSLFEDPNKMKLISPETYQVIIKDKELFMKKITQSHNNIMSEICETFPNPVVAHDASFYYIKNKESLLNDIQSVAFGEHFEKYNSNGTLSFILSMGSMNKMQDSIKNANEKLGINSYDIVLDDYSLSLSVIDNTTGTLVGISVFEIIDHSSVCDILKIDNPTQLNSIFSKKKDCFLPKNNFGMINNFKKWVKIVSIETKNNSYKSMILSETLRVILILKTFFIGNLTHINYESSMTNEDSYIYSKLMREMFGFYPIDNKHQHLISKLRPEYESLEDKLCILYETILKVANNDESLDSIMSYVQLIKDIKLALANQDETDIKKSINLELLCGLNNNFEKEAFLNFEGQYSKFPAELSMGNYRKQLHTIKQDMEHIKNKLDDFMNIYPKLIHVENIQKTMVHEKEFDMYFIKLSDKLEKQKLEEGLKLNYSQLSRKRKQENNSYDSNTKKPKTGGLGEKLNCVLCFDHKPSYCPCT
jgi:hypothetical protein